MVAQCCYAISILFTIYCWYYRDTKRSFYKYNNKFNITIGITYNCFGRCAVCKAQMAKRIGYVADCGNNFPDRWVYDGLHKKLEPLAKTLRETKMIMRDAFNASLR